jgi:hypothetical protein
VTGGGIDPLSHPHGGSVAGGAELVDDAPRDATARREFHLVGLKAPSCPETSGRDAEPPLPIMGRKFLDAVDRLGGVATLRTSVPTYRPFNGG